MDMLITTTVAQNFIFITKYTNKTIDVGYNSFFFYRLKETQIEIAKLIIKK